MRKDFLSILASLSDQGVTYVFISLMKYTEVKSSLHILSICDSLFPFRELEQYIC